VKEEKMDAEEMKGLGMLMNLNKALCKFGDATISEQDAEIAALKAELAALRAENERMENLLAMDVHSCGPNCQRDGCVNRRLREENDLLRAKLLCWTLP
jgi:hypothetical protein